MDPDNIDLALISLVEKCPTLYDKRRKDFKDAIKKKNSWQTINTTLGINGELRWKVLRDRYVKEKRKEKLVPSGSSPMKSSWPYLPYLSFLNEYIISRNTTSNIKKSFKPVQSGIQNEQPELASEYILEGMDSEEMLSPIPSTSSLQISIEDSEADVNAIDPLLLSLSNDAEATPSICNATINEDIQTTLLKGNKKKGVQSEVDIALKEVANYLKTKPQEDSDLTFGKYVGNILQELPKRKKTVLRRKIMEAIEEVEDMDC